RFDLRNVPLLGRASFGRAKCVEATVGRDPVEPGADRCASLEPSEALPRRQQCVLQNVLGVLQGSEHPVAVHLQLSTVGLGQLSERLAITGACPRDEVGRQHSSPASLSRSYRHRPDRESGGECAPIFAASSCLNLSTARTIRPLAGGVYVTIGARNKET